MKIRIDFSLTTFAHFAKKYTCKPTLSTQHDCLSRDVHFYVIQATLCDFNSMYNESLNRMKSFAKYQF